MRTSPISWSIHRGRRHLEQFNLTDHKAVTEDYGRLDMERVEIAPGIVANIADIKSRQAFSLVSDLAPQGDRICIQTTLNGIARLDVEDGVETRYREGVSVAHALPGTMARFAFPRSSNLKVLTFTFSADAFNDRMPDGVPELFREFLKGSSNPRAQAQIRTSTLVRQIAETAFAERLTGSLRQLQIDGMSRLLIAHFGAGLCGDAPSLVPRGMTRSDRDRIYDVRERILADPANLPNLQDLARIAGIDHKRLNSGFRQLFGTTVFEFCRNHRLDSARARLLDGGALLKEVAHEAGYAHVSNFVTAYRRRFGSTPGTDRDEAV